MLLHYADGLSIPKIAEILSTTVPKVNRCVDKALELGSEAAFISLACQKPKELGYSYEVWPQRLLAQHVRNHAVSAGHECLSRMSPSSVYRLLNAHDLQPHKVCYYLERRDPEFDTKRAEVLCVYQQVEYIWENEELKRIAAGATVVNPMADQFYGDRAGSVKDPFGHYWMISTTIEIVEPEEIQKRFLALYVN
ncbi:hypothetical protein E8L90_09725 [Brevibacillus antibioticus]|uniref:Uncharacterized protein n=1 Tax=Brevibacillus antibioticus TaxID=2570228 RepID=A0A4U2Y5E3_9BACL|nr:hypothetical protein [Brevibacillus antibioticus]TKI55699.1 hypothetical protein E8L90_09725 [Brevibacillus antibioticus]